MKLSHVFVLNTFISVSYAAGFLFIPNTLISWHGMVPDTSLILMSRYFGVALLGIGLVTWFARNAEDSKTRDAITNGLALAFIVGVALSLQATLAGQLNAMGWLPVSAYLILIAGYGYFRFNK